MYSSVKLTKNKTFEIQLEILNHLTNEWLNFNILWTTKRDHAGVFFTFSCLKFVYFEINIHDNRHWNSSENRWFLPDEEWF